MVGAGIDTIVELGFDSNNLDLTIYLGLVSFGLVYVSSTKETHSGSSRALSRTLVPGPICSGLIIPFTDG